MAFFETCATVGLRISRHRVVGILINFTEEHKNLGTNSTSTVHKSCAASRRHPRKQRTVRNEIWGYISGRDRKTGAMCPRRRVETCQVNLKAQRNGQSYLLLTYRWVDFAGRIHNKPRGKKEFVVDSGASMHMVSKKDLCKAELETVRVSKNPTMVVTTNSEVLVKAEATGYVRELDLFVKVMLLENAPAILSLGKLCEDNWYSWNHI